MRRLQTLSTYSRTATRQDILAALRSTIQDMNIPPPVRPRIPRPIPRGLFPTKLFESHPMFVRKIYLLVFTGNILKNSGSYQAPISLSESPDFILDFADLDFLDEVISYDEEESGLEIVKLLVYIMEMNLCPWRSSGLLMVYIKCVFSGKSKISKKAIDEINRICDLPKKFHLFLTLTQKYKHHVVKEHREISGEEMRKRRLQRLMNSSEPSEDKPSSTKKKKTVPEKKTQAVSKEENKTEENEETKAVSKEQKKVKKALKVKPKLYMDKIVKRCVQTYYSNIAPELLLYFFSKYRYTENMHEMNMRIMQQAHPKFVNQLHNLVVTYELHGLKKFRREADKYTNDNPMIGSTAKNIINGVLLLAELENRIYKKEQQDSLEPNKGSPTTRLTSIWKETGKRDQYIKEGSMKYNETGDEYCTEEENGFHFSIEHIPGPLLHHAEVFS